MNLNGEKKKHWAKAFLAHPVPHKPGTHFRYNTPRDLHAIGDRTKSDWSHGFGLPQTSLVQTAGNRRSKMGNQSPKEFRLVGMAYTCEQKTLPKLGQLYLQKGRWNEKQILPESWVEQATSKQVSNGSDPTKDWDQGYGFQFWRCRHNAYRGDGKDGQFCIVLTGARCCGRNHGKNRKYAGAAKHRVGQAFTSFWRNENG